MEWHQRRRSTWVSAIHGNCQQFMAIHQFSVSRNSQATKSKRNRRIFQCCVRFPVVNIVDILLPVNHRLSSPHTTLGTFNLLCLSKDWHRTELTRLRKQSEMQVREGVWCVLECYTVESEQIWGSVLLFGGCIARGDFETAPCLLWRVLLWFRQAQSETANVGAELWSFGYEKTACFHSIGRSSFALAPRLYKQKRSVEHKQNPHAWPVVDLPPSVVWCEDLILLGNWSEDLPIGKSLEIIISRWFVEFVALLRQCSRT